MWRHGVGEKSKSEMQAQGREKSTDFEASIIPSYRTGSGKALRGIFVLVHYFQGGEKTKNWAGAEEKIHRF